MGLEGSKETCDVILRQGTNKNGNAALSTLDTIELGNLEVLEGEHEDEILQEVAQVVPADDAVKTAEKKRKQKRKTPEECFDIKEENERNAKYEIEKEKNKERRLLKSIQEHAEKTLKVSILYCTDENPQNTMDVDTVLKLETKIWFIPHEKLTVNESEINMCVNGTQMDMLPYMQPVEELSQLYNSERYCLAISHPQRWGNFINLQVLCRALDSLQSGMAICNICGWKNCRPNEVKFHLIRNHTAIRDYLCDLCGSKFTDWRQLWRHKYSHVPTENRQRYHCDTCGKVFDQKGKLTRHMHIHQGTHLNQMCEQCGKAFRCRNHLKRHVNSVHQNLRAHLCPLCSRSYKEKRDLKRHMLVLHNITENELEQTADGTYHVVDSQRKLFKIYECVFCGTECRDRTDMRRHLKKAHPDNKVTDDEISTSVKYSPTPLPPALLPHQMQYPSKTTSPIKDTKKDTLESDTLQPVPIVTQVDPALSYEPSLEPVPSIQPPVSMVTLQPAVAMVTQAGASQLQQQLSFSTSAPQISMATDATSTVLRPQHQDTALQTGVGVGVGGGTAVPLLQYQMVQVLPEGTIAIPYEYPQDVQQQQQQQIPTVTYSLQ